MFEINGSYQSSAIDETGPVGDDRLSPGTALLAVFGLSLLGWAVMLAPIVAIVYR